MYALKDRKAKWISTHNYPLKYNENTDTNNMRALWHKNSHRSTIAKDTQNLFRYGKSTTDGERLYQTLITRLPQNAATGFAETLFWSLHQFLAILLQIIVVLLIIITIINIIISHHYYCAITMMLLYCQCWVHDLSVFFVFFITLTCFPALQASTEALDANFVVSGELSSCILVAIQLLVDEQSALFLFSKNHYTD